MATKARVKREVAEMKLPASLRALKDQAKQMFDRIDNERAALFVQQTANGHDDDDVWAEPEDGPAITYAGRREYLDGSERNLRENLPQSVLKALATPSGETP